MQVVSAAVTVNIQYLAGGEEAGTQSAFQRIRTELRGEDAACGDLCQFQSHDTGHSQGEEFRLMGDPAQFAVGQGLGQAGQFQSRLLQNHSAQTVVQDAGEEIFQQRLLRLL